MAKILIELDGGKKYEFHVRESDAKRILGELIIPQENPIVSDVAKAIQLENVRVSREYEIADCVNARLKVSTKSVRLVVEICGDYYTIFNSRREDFSFEDFERTAKSLYEDTEGFLFKVITQNNTDVQFYGIYPSKYVRVIPDFLVKFNSHYSAGVPDKTPENVIGLAVSNAHFLVGVYRDEIPDIPSGVLGSLVRKGHLLTERETKIYLPNPNREQTFLSKREREAIEIIEKTVKERIRTLNELYGENLTIEDVTWKIIR